MDVQCKFRFIVYIAGHSGALRLASLFHDTGCCVLVVDAEDDIPGDMWLHSFLTGLYIANVDDEVEPDINVTHLSIRPDLSNLVPTLEWAAAHEKDCYRIMVNGVETARRYSNRTKLVASLASIIETACI